MVPVKVNVFISYAPEDKPQLDILLRWLYPMRDEVNIWYKNMPMKAPELPLPWQLLLFWYTPSDQSEKYRAIHERRREKAHIYLFLTSYKSLSDNDVEEDIVVAAQRRIQAGDVLGPHVYPVILSPSRWKQESSLGAYKPMAGGLPLSSFKQPEEGYLLVTEELAALIKVLQPRLGELKFYKSRDVGGINYEQLGGGNLPDSYLGDDDEALEFEERSAFQPPEWLGWSLLLFIFISLISGLMPSRVLGPSRYDRILNENDHGWEYMREKPMMPPKDTMPFPPLD